MAQVTGLGCARVWPCISSQRATRKKEAKVRVPHDPPRCDRDQLVLDVVVRRRMEKHEHDQQERGTQQDQPADRVRTGHLITSRKGNGTVI